MALAFRHRRGVHRAEYCVGHLAAPRREQCQLLRPWGTGSFALGISKQVFDPRVAAIEHLAIHPLVVDGQAQGLAHPHVL